MTESKAFWTFLAETLHQGEPAALLVVADHHGSSPGKAGAKMIVTGERRLGTIGGGTVERELLQRARGLLESDAAEPQIYRHDHHGSADGMICGGSQTTLLYSVNGEMAEAVEATVAAMQEKRSGTLQFTASGISFCGNAPAGPPRRFVRGKENRWLYEEAAGLLNAAYIIGGGHVGLALSRILATLDFHVTVIDERTGLETFENNAYAHEKIVAAYEAVEKKVPGGPGCHAFIMTHSHDRDQLVLQRLFGKPMAYLGLLGSRRKIAKILQNLQIPEDRLPQHFHAPIGLPIHSRTPAEIAISIAAQIIALRNLPQPDKKPRTCPD